MSRLAEKPGGSAAANNSGGAENGAQGFFSAATLSRLLRILQRRWPICLACAVLWGGVALAVGFSSSGKKTYKVEGILVYTIKAAPDGSASAGPAPLSLATHQELIKARSNVELVCKKMNLDIPPDVLASKFTVTNPPNTDQLSVALSWENGEQAAEMVNNLMTLYIAQVKAEREKATKDAVAELDARIREATKRQSKAQQEASDYWEKRKVFPDINTELARVTAAIQGSKSSLEQQEQTRTSITTQLAKVQQDLKDFEEKFKQKDPKLKAQVDDASNKLISEQTLRIEAEERNLRSLRNKLKELSEEYEADRKLGTAVARAELRKKELALQDLQDQIKSAEKTVALLKTDLDRVKNNPTDAPFFVNTRNKQLDLQSQLIGLNGVIEKIKLDQAAALAEAGRLKRLKNEPEAVALEIALQSAEEEIANLKKQLGSLREKQNDQSFSIKVPAVAGSAVAPKATKTVLLVFCLPLLISLGLVLAYDMSSNAWRAESLASRLGLPVLAQARGIASAPRDFPGQTLKVSQDEARGVALRVRQYVPESGGTFLFSALNSGSEVDALVSDFTRYLAIRDERVLILDARIANLQNAGLARLIERPVEVLSVDGNLSQKEARADPILSGLVQYLVFDGHDTDAFIHKTALPGVDYMPPGGPYPVTDVLASEPMKELLEGLRKKYTVIVLVGPAIAQTIDTEILAAYVNGMILLINGTVRNTGPVEAFIASLKEANAPLLGSVLAV